MSAKVRAALRNETNVTTALARLAADGFVERKGEAWRTTRRWQQAMARAAVKLYDASDPGDDLRVPICLAFLERYAELDDEQLADLVEEMLPIEAASLGLQPTSNQQETIPS
jgi:hypothetical protein